MPPSQTPEFQSTFQVALTKYIESLPEKKQKKSFIAACHNQAELGKLMAITPEYFSESIEKIGANHSGKRPLLRGVFKDVVDTLVEYTDVINNLVSAYPLPTAIIWGALSIFINAAQRYYHILDQIRKQLREVAVQLHQIASYNELFGDCKVLQGFLCDSYINMFRFWNKVHRELSQPKLKSMASSFLPFNAEKLDAIINDMKEDVRKIGDQADILEKQNQKEERGAQSRFRQEQEYNKLNCTIRAWLQQQKASSENSNRHNALWTQRTHGTCDWLFEHPEYTLWRKGGTQSPVLWLHAPPGSGKSMLCSYVIHSIEQSNPQMALAYHFYRFDKSFKALEVLRHLACQMFLGTGFKSRCSTKVLQELVDNVEARGEIDPLQCIQGLIVTLVECLPEAYFFLDGVDEELAGDGRNEANTVLDFLKKLAKQFAYVRFWSSSQEIPCVVQKHEPEDHIIQIKEQTKMDMITYLLSKMTSLDMSEKDRDDVLLKLQESAVGSFLWARLIVEDLEKANSPADTSRIIREGPTSLDVYYERFFKRLEKNDLSLARYIFALVAFARRPLRIKELREAIGMLRSRDAQSNSRNAPSLNRDEIPYIRSLCKLFAPLIEVESDTDVVNDHGVCRLYHSTVLEFLRRNAEILCTSSAVARDQTGHLRICPRVIADACLLYLSQDRYSHLLSRPHGYDNWLDGEDPVVEHQFLTYSAKYWDRHLDSFQMKNSSDSDAQKVDVEIRVAAFLKSPNFQTCIQVQSLFVDAHFGLFRVSGNFGNLRLRRVFPEWFVKTTHYGRRFLASYHSFWYDWKFFLSCGNCEELDCVFKPYAGEINRCWWGALGPRNVFSEMEGQLYTSFRFQSDEGDDFERKISFEGVGEAGDELTNLHLISHQEGQLEFSCELWTLTADEKPALQKRQTILVQESSSNWLQYMKYEGEDSELCNVRKDRALPVAFSDSCRFLRIGTQVYARDKTGNYAVITFSHTKHDQQPAYIEEFAGRENFVVLATRRSAITEAKLQEDRTNGSVPGTRDSSKSEGGSASGTASSNPTKKPSDEGANSGNESNDADEDSDSESSIDESDDASEDSETSHETDDEAYESWSECTSGGPDDSQFEDDTIAPFHDWTDSDGKSDTSGSQSSEEENTEDEDDQDNETDHNSKDSSESDSSSEESEDIDPRSFGYGQWRNYGEEQYMSDDEGCYGVTPRRKKKSQSASARSEPKSSITVFDTRTSVPEKVFHLSKKLCFMLYDSPPVIHPIQPLVVWPLGGGDVLFADFQINTYFIRRLKPSTLYARHIFMKCHFSACGCYLHIASLEGQRRPPPKRKARNDEAKPEMKLALLVSTYRLCNKRASRAPPTLINRVRVELGSVTTLLVSKLPYTLTWTSNELYFTCSHMTLRVYRIRLFSNENTAPESNHPVLKPCKMILLPSTARERDVYYFPPRTGRSFSRIIIGSEARTENEIMAVQGPNRNPLPPIGCNLNEEKDIGGWINSTDHSDIPQKRGIGRLDRPLEKFNPEEDCDLEPFLFLG